MNLLLDTHALLWWLAGEPVADDALARLSSPDVLVAVSAVSVWEAGIKVALGKLTVPGSLVEAVRDERFELLAVTGEHAERAAGLPPHHRDPFDRMLVAQAQAEGLAILTRDPAFAPYDVPTAAC